MAAVRNRKRKGPMSEINVVPYIDVMLVLLVIFMITAPLLSQGVKVDLPQAEAKPVQTRDQEPLIVSVDANGDYYLNISGDEERINHETMVEKVVAVLSLRPATQVLIRGDADVTYGKVVTAMALLQKAGVKSVGLLTEPPQKVRKRK
jgi:biopolymer transport protein TolR